MDLSLGKLQQLMTVARSGSISRAAAELNVSQPALSRSIAAIEERYGFAIFNRFGHGVEPTSAGAQVLEQVGPLIQDLHVFESNMRQLGAGEAGVLAMGMAPLLASQLLGRLSAAFFVARGETQMRVMIRPGGELMEALKANEIELFFYPGSHLAPTDDLEVRHVGNVQPVCVVRNGHPLVGKTSLSVADLVDYPWACSVEQPAGFEIPGKARMICDNYHILREAVLATDLVCICATDFVAAELRKSFMVEIKIEGLPMPPTPIYMAKLKGRMTSPLANAAISRITSYLAPAGPLTCEYC